MEDLSFHLPLSVFGCVIHVIPRQPFFSFPLEQKNTHTQNMEIIKKLKRNVKVSLAFRYKDK
jgi:hypothetical protein